MNPIQSLVPPDIIAQVGFAVVVTLTFTGALIAVLPRNILYNVLGLALGLTGVAASSSTWGAPSSPSWSF